MFSHDSKPQLYTIYKQTKDIIANTFYCAITMEYFIYVYAVCNHVITLHLLIWYLDSVGIAELDVPKANKLTYIRIYMDCSGPG